MSSTPFTFAPGGWYAMTMYPGYGEEPYRSPIEVHAIRLLGRRRFVLTFYNVGYAAGVQMMEKQFRTVHRHAGALITVEDQATDRTTIFEPLTGAWVSAFTPAFNTMMIEALGRSQLLGLYRAG